MISEKVGRCFGADGAARRMPDTNALDVDSTSLVCNALVYWPRRFVKEMTAQLTRMLENDEHAEGFSTLCR